MSENKKVKILIIEDEEALANVLYAKIEKEGYEVEIAYDGEEGYKKIKKWKPDLILLDIVMPKMDGYEVMEKINEEELKIPVIVISNSGQPVEIEKTKKLGAVDHLIKTEFDPSEVMDKIKKYLDNLEEAVAEKEEIKPKNGDGGESLDTKVLVIEDDSFLLSIITKKLSKSGYTVYEAVDGEKALEQIDKIEPNIVLLDIILPAINGFEVLEKIRSHKKENIKKVPVLMLSNLGEDNDIKKAKDMGANDYLVKAHFTTEEIIEKIEKTLKEN